MALLRSFAAVALTALALAPAKAQLGFPNLGLFPEPVRLTWRLENPFRLFRNPADTLRHRRAWLSLSKHDRETAPVLSAEHLLQAEAGTPGWASAVFGQTCFDPKSGRYTGCANYVMPVSHAVLVKLTGSFPSSAQCRWSAADALGRALARRNGPCAGEEKFDIPYPSGGTVEVRQGGTLIARQFIRVEDILVVGLGDSIGSGEGNPDRPVHFDDHKQLSYGHVIVVREGVLRWPRRLDGYPQRAGNWKKLFDPAFNRAAAGWLDPRCHRSLYSYQARVALELAAENEQRAVTFLGFACTGAATLDGIFLSAAVRECVAHEPARVPSQISQLVFALCRVKPQIVPLPDEIANMLPEISGISAERRRALRCPPDKFLRKPDLILISLGANDIGFSEMVADAILYQRSFYRLLAEQLDSVHDAKRGAEKLKNLPRHYDALARALSLYIGLPQTGQGNVLISSYPDMGHAEDGKTLCKGTAGMEMFPPFAIDAKRLSRIEDLSGELHGTLRAAAKAHGWTLVDEFQPGFAGRGLCARGDPNNPADDLMLPLHRHGGWEPFKPSLYQPYAPRQRWVRTPNDAFMTVNYHQESFGRASCRDLGSLVYNPFQLFLAGTYGGSFHPTAEGQAAIADAVVRRAREILAARERAAPQR